MHRVITLTMTLAYDLLTYIQSSFFVVRWRTIFFAEDLREEEVSIILVIFLVKFCFYVFLIICNL